MLPEVRAGEQPSTKSDSTRRELLRLVLRDVLGRQGIPAAWLGAEILANTSRSGVQGLHWRILVRHWDARLITHAVALQQKLVTRVTELDPLAGKWLTGISWQFALPDESVCPGLPHPGTWTALPSKATPEVNAASPGPTVDVIAGPVRISGSGPSKKKDAGAQTRADLERLLAAREADYHRHSSSDTSESQSQFMATQPMRYD
jgi:hypothetical protein